MSVAAGWRTTGVSTLLYGTSAPATLRSSEDTLRPAVVDALSVNNFRTATYCGCQDPMMPSVRHVLMKYYKEQFSRICLWDTHDTPSAAKREETSPSKGLESSAVKTESEEESSTSRATSSSFKAVGILTDVSGMMAVSPTASSVPWEFHVISHPDDADDYIPALTALKRNAENTSGVWLNLVAGTAGESARGDTHFRQREDDDEINPMKVEALDEADGRRLSLYTQRTDVFTGVYPGMAVGILGESFQRSRNGVLTGVLVHRIITPHYPVLPWGFISRPVPSSSAKVTSRIQFCSGPYPRMEILPLLKKVVQQALQREADLLIIGGPLVTEFGESERGILPVLGRTFAELLESYTEVIEEIISSFYATRPNVPHMKVVLVPHRDDVTQMPVLPVTGYAIQDGEDVMMRSNPCRISVNGIHIGVCNEDIVGPMQTQMLERWTRTEGNLRRVVEAVIQGRSAAPLYGLPAPVMDILQLDRLRFTYMPDGREDGTAEKWGWNAMREILHSGVKKEEPEEDEEPDKKRTKTEDDSAESPASTNGMLKSSSVTEQYEFFPHILFLPSTRPAFGLVSHRGQRNASSGKVSCECDLDDYTNTSGVLVINQEVWSAARAKGSKFVLRVAEVSVLDSEAVLQNGPSTSTVSCGLIYVYNDGM